MTLGGIDGPHESQAAPRGSESPSRSPYMARRAIAAVVVLALALVGVANPWNLVVVDRVLNHPFVATIIVACLMLDVLRYGTAHESERTALVGRLVIAVFCVYWLAGIWLLAWLHAVIGLLIVGLALLTALTVNARRNRLTWPVEGLAIPLIVAGVFAPFVGAAATVFSNHGAAPSAHASPFTDAHVDSEQVDGLCSGITNWLRRGEGLAAREVHLGGDCEGFEFTAPDRLEVTCYDYQGTERDEYVGRTIVFDPVSLKIESDTGDVRC